MNIKSKLTLAIGILVAMIVLLVVLSVVNLQKMCIRDRVNPNDTEQIENAICRALEMPFEEQKERMHRMQSIVSPVSYTHLDVYKRQGYGSG